LTRPEFYIPEYSPDFPGNISSIFGNPPMSSSLVVGISRITHRFLFTLSGRPPKLRFPAGDHSIVSANSFFRLFLPRIAKPCCWFLGSEHKPGANGFDPAGKHSFGGFQVRKNCKAGHVSGTSIQQYEIDAICHLKSNLSSCSRS
jgi:hypothetical protein